MMLAVLEAPAVLVFSSSWGAGNPGPPGSDVPRF